MVVPEASKAQLVIVRGLFGKWKQAVYLDFNDNMTVDKVKEVAITLHSVGLLPCRLKDHRGETVLRLSDCCERD